MENTRTTGTFCSMQSMKAVRSMTRNPRVTASR